MKKTVSMVMVLFLMLCLNGCQEKQEQETKIQSVSVSNTSTTNIDYEFEEEDFDDSYDDSATSILLKDTGIEIDGDGASASGSVVTIQSAGTYVLEGTLTDGQIVVEASKKDTVRIVLKQASITSSTTSAIYVKQADKTILILAEGSENKVVDTKSDTYEDAEKEEPNAAIFSKDDLTITGSGSLQVTGNGNHGIFSKNKLVITDGTYVINSANDGLKGKDGIAIANGSFTIHAQGDGLQASEDTQETKGWVYIQSGEFNIDANQDGIQAETYLEIVQGTFTITCGGGSENASTKSDWGNWGPANQNVSTEDTTSAKGIKAGKDLIISNGTYELNTSDDALHCNASMLIKNGTYTIQSGDDGMHADAILTIDQGKIDIQKSYEGIEASEVIVNDGTIQVVSSDDGFNAAGGNDASSISGRPGENSFSSDSDISLTINGGNLYVRADGDGLDSNGDLFITGGIVTIDGPQDNGNGALDYDGTCEITGGTLIAVGMSGMAQMPSSSSSQPSVMITYSSIQSANTLVSILDGNEALLSYAPSISFNNIVISTPNMVQNGTYTLTSGGSVNGETDAKVYLTPTLKNQTTLCDFTLSSMTMSISDSGSTVSNGGMGQGGHGGDMGRGGPGGF